MHELKKVNPNIFLQNCIFIPLPATKMFKDVVGMGYKPPTTLLGWSKEIYPRGLKKEQTLTGCQNTN